MQPGAFTQTRRGEPCRIGGDSSSTLLALSKASSNASNLMEFDAFAFKARPTWNCICNSLKTQRVLGGTEPYSWNIFDIPWKFAREFQCTGEYRSDRAGIVTQFLKKALALLNEARRRYSLERRSVPARSPNPAIGYFSQFRYTFRLELTVPERHEATNKRSSHSQSTHWPPMSAPRSSPRRHSRNGRAPHSRSSRPR